MEADDASAVRVDKWLWAVRVFKTRPLATEACRAGTVTVGELTAKPSRAVRPGEVVNVRQGVWVRTLKVIAAPPSRVGAARVAEFCVELTLPEEFAKAREWRTQQTMAGTAGEGRPTKRDRRLRDRLFD